MHTWWKLKWCQLFKFPGLELKNLHSSVKNFKGKKVLFAILHEEKKNLFYWFWKRKNWKTRLYCEIVNTVNNGLGFPSYWVLGFLYILQRPGTILKLSRSDLSSSWMEEIVSEWMPNICPQWALYRGVCCGFAWPQDKTGTWQGTVYRYSFLCGVICLRQKI